MSDTCSMRVRTRDVDAEAFDALGFCRSETTGRVVTLYDEQANYGYYGSLPETAVFRAWHGAGVNYNAQVIVCDGDSIARLPTSNEGYELLPLIEQSVDANGYCELVPDTEKLCDFSLVARNTHRILKEWEALEQVVNAPVLVPVPVDSIQVRFTRGIVSIPLARLVPYLSEDVVLEIQEEGGSWGVEEREAHISWRLELRQAAKTVLRAASLPAWLEFGLDDCYVYLKVVADDAFAVVELP